jgi:hypothetical protein
MLLRRRRRRGSSAVSAKSAHPTSCQQGTDSYEEVQNGQLEDTGVMTHLNFELASGAVHGAMHGCMDSRFCQIPHLIAM